MSSVRGSGGIIHFFGGIIFLGESSMQNILTLNNILWCFEIAFGLGVNFYKSRITSINVEKRLVEVFADTLNCKMMEIPFIYLGLLVRENQRCLTTWQPVIAKIKKCLCSWRQQQLSFGGRVCLIKYVLNAILLYYLSMFRVPITIIMKIICIQRNFL